MDDLAGEPPGVKAGKAVFASTTLAARIERAECRTIVDGAKALERRRPDAGVLVRPLAGGVAVRTLEGSPLNKVAGLGFEGAVDQGELAQVEEAFAERGMPVQVELSSLADPSVGELLTRRGYVLKGFENVLGRSLPAEDRALPRAPTSEGIEVGLGGASDLDAWLDVVVTGFAEPDTQGRPSHESFPREVLAEIMGDMAASEHFTRYLAHHDGVLAGGACMRIFEGVAQLCGAATLPAHRRRGIQSALLAERLAAATRAGCDVAVVTTQPGSKSAENVQRQGFELLYGRAVLVRGQPGG